MAKQVEPFAWYGDSGSLVFAEDGSPIGLVTAVQGRRTIGCKATHIEELLDVSFTPPAGVQLTPVRYDPTRFPTDPKDRFDVLICGISIGHPLVMAGTLGAFVWDKETGELFGLSCAHVIAPHGPMVAPGSPGAIVGDPIYQPGPFDIRTKLGREPTDNDIAGHLVRWEEISSTRSNLIDAAVFKPTRPVWPNYVFGFGERELRRPKMA